MCNKKIPVNGHATINILQVFSTCLIGRVQLQVLKSLPSQTLVIVMILRGRQDLAEVSLRFISVIVRCTIEMIIMSQSCTQN